MEILFFLESFSLLHFFSPNKQKKNISYLFLHNKFKKKFSPTRLFGTPVVFGTLEFLAVLKVSF